MGYGSLKGKSFKGYEYPWQGSKSWKGMGKSWKGKGTSVPSVYKPYFDKKGSGKAFYHNGKSGSKGKDGSGKGKDTTLTEIPASLKVWVGGLPEDATREDLQAHFRDVGKITWAQILPNSVGCVAFLTETQAYNAIETYDGSDMYGYTIQVDTWERKPMKGKAGSGKGGKGKFGGKFANGNTFGKSRKLGKGKAKGKGKGKGKKGKTSNPLQRVDPSLKVWIGNIAEGVTWQELESHFKEAGATWWAELLPNGSGCVAYKATEEVDLAIEMLGGTELKGQTIEVDRWQELESTTLKKKGLASTRKDNIKKTFLKWTAGKPKKGKGRGKGRDEYLSKIEPALKVSVRNVCETVSVGMLKNLFSRAGEVTHATVHSGKGTGCVAFKTHESAERAILELGGSKLLGQALAVERFEKPEIEETQEMEVAVAEDAEI